MTRQLPVCIFLFPSYDTANVNVNINEGFFKIIIFKQINLLATTHQATCWHVICFSSLIICLQLFVPRHEKFITYSTGYYISDSKCQYFLDGLFKPFFEAAIYFCCCCCYFKAHHGYVPFSSYLNFNNGLFSLFPLGTDDTLRTVYSLPLFTTF